MYNNNAYISSIILFLVSLIYIYFLKEKLILGIIALILGLTSIKHHSRLDKWIIRDFWCYLDMIMVLLFFIVFTYYFYDSKRWIILIIFAIILYIYVSNFCLENEKPFYHSLIHYLVILFLLSDIYLNEINN